MRCFPRGFTLIEVLVTITIISILAGVVTMVAITASVTGRDADRQTDLRALQAAVEAYYRDNGRYPEGCRGAGNWSGEAGTAFACPSSMVPPNQYIVGLAPQYISRLPSDPNRSGCVDTSPSPECGYAYVTNAEGSVYKIIAMNTVEGPDVTLDHPFKSCDVKALGQNDIREAGWCGVRPTGGVIDNSFPCFSGMPSILPHQQFRNSFAVWGGFARLKTFDFDPGIGCAGSPSVCVNPYPPPGVDMFDSFLNTSGVTVTPPSPAVANRARVSSVRGTTEVICR